MNRLAKALGNVPPEALEEIIRHVELRGNPKDRGERVKIALENVQLYYNKLLPRMMEHNEPPVQEIVDLLVNSCVVEKNFEEALNTFSIQVHGREIEIDQSKFRTWIEKLGNLRMYRQVIHSMGLGAFEDELISLEISKTMGPPPAQPQQQPAPKPTVVPVPIERNRRGRR